MTTSKIAFAGENMITDRDQHYLARACLVSKRSKDPSTKVGCVIIKDDRQVGDGFNGFPRGIADDDRLNDRQEKYELIIHAEMNALLHTGRQDCEGATLYIWGFAGPPCRNCTKHIIQAGIRRVVCAGPGVPKRWQKPLAHAGETLKEAGVELCIANDSH